MRAGQRAGRDHLLRDHHLRGLSGLCPDPADWTLLEVGLGGRLDATNVVEKPALTIITPVSIDHQQYLGDTVPEIAGEKAGIIKRGVPVASSARSTPTGWP
jgi:folylpolyglutamate synthase/dihydropteroate synthase